MDNDQTANPDDAQATLRDIAAARQHVARRSTAPWWYHVGAALSTATLFIGMGLVVGQPNPSSTAESASVLLIALGACVAPVVLLASLKHVTGVSIDRYAHGMAAWYAGVFSLLAVAFILQQFAAVPYAFPVAADVAFLITLINERHLDSLLRQRIRAGG